MKVRHRDPAPRLRPKDQVFNLAWGTEMTVQERRKLGEGLLQAYQIKTPRHLTDCSTCHR